MDDECDAITQVQAMRDDVANDDEQAVNRGRRDGETERRRRWTQKGQVYLVFQSGSQGKGKSNK